MTWSTEAWRVLVAGRPMEAVVSVANVTQMPMALVARMTFSTGGTRIEKATVQPTETWTMKIRTIFGSQASDPQRIMTGLTVTCDGGAVACPVSVTWLAAPTCEGQP